MTNKSRSQSPKDQEDKNQKDIAHLGMMGDGTEEQNLDERGNPAARIKRDQVKAAFEKQIPE